MDKHLHIVSLDVPFPADYGGVIDVFYKIVWLHKQGVKIHLHCFTKGRTAQPELEKYCEEVHYYERRTGWKGFSFSLPYIISSRKSKELLEELKKDDHPVLFEGMHTTYWLYKNELKNRQIFIRLHNVEYKYYEQLANHERNFFRRLYFKREAIALRKYEKAVALKGILLSLSRRDTNIFSKASDATEIHEIPVFTPWNEVTSFVGGSGSCLYHGNLSVNENEKAVLWLTEKIFDPLKIELKVIGKSPSIYLKKQLQKYPVIRLLENPDDETIFKFLQQALINTLPSFNDTGVKLKLLNALYNSRYCIVNSNAVAGSGLEELCVIADTEAEFGRAIRHLLKRPFTAEDIAQKKAVLGEKYSNEKNSLLLMSLLR